MDIAAKRAQELRSRYLSEAVQTATPAGRLVMLYDALELDLLRADQAFEVGTDLRRSATGLDPRPGDHPDPA